MGRTKDPEAVLRAKKAKWTLLWDNGWILYTLCKGCKEVKYCRGKTRDQMKCEQCFLST